MNAPNMPAENIRFVLPPHHLPEQTSPHSTNCVDGDDVTDSQPPARTNPQQTQSETDNDQTINMTHGELTRQTAMPTETTHPHFDYSRQDADPQAHFGDVDIEPVSQQPSPSSADAPVRHKSADHDYDHAHPDDDEFYSGPGYPENVDPHDHRSADDNDYEFENHSQTEEELSEQIEPEAIPTQKRNANKIVVNIVFGLLAIIIAGLGTISLFPSLFAPKVEPPDVIKSYGIGPMTEDEAGRKSSPLSTARGIAALPPARVPSVEAFVPASSLRPIPTQEAEPTAIPGQNAAPVAPAVSTSAQIDSIEKLEAKIQTLSVDLAVLKDAAPWQQANQAGSPQTADTEALKASVKALSIENTNIKQGVNDVITTLNKLSTIVNALSDKVAEQASRPVATTEQNRSKAAPQGPAVTTTRSVETAQAAKNRQEANHAREKARQKLRAEQRRTVHNDSPKEGRAQTNCVLAGTDDGNTSQSGAVAWIKNSSTDALLEVSVGQNIPCLGRITSIKDGSVTGTKGTLRVN